eukprot:368057-Pelagomonas_calceolata.AAC.1
MKSILRKAVQEEKQTDASAEVAGWACAHHVRMIVVKRQSKGGLVCCQFIFFLRVNSLNIPPHTLQSVPQIISEILLENRCPMLYSLNKRLATPQSLKTIQGLSSPTRRHLVMLNHRYCTFVVLKAGNTYLAFVWGRHSVWTSFTRFGLHQRQNTPGTRPGITETAPNLNG